MDFGFGLHQSFSIEYWIRIEPGNASSGDAGIIAKGYDSSQSQPWYLSRYVTSQRGVTSQGGVVDFYLRDFLETSRVATSSTAVDDGQWHHVVGVYDSPATEIRIVVDGVLEGTAGDVPPDYYGANSGPFTIANHLNRALDGSVDEVAVYDTALTADQVATHYTAGSGKEPESRTGLKIDFGSAAGAGSGPGARQAGFFSFEATEAGGASDVTRTFPSELGVDRQVDVTLGGYTHWRDYAAATGVFADLSSLLSDCVLANAEATIALTLENLLDGTYEITTYHHTTQFGPSDRPPATTFDILKTDGVVSSDPVVLGAEMSDNASFELSTQTFEFTVQGGSPVRIEFVRGPSLDEDDHFALPGFELAVASGVIELTWDEQGDGNWGTIDPGNGYSRWVDGSGPTPSVPGAADNAVVRSDVVTVAENRAAGSLIVESGGLTVAENRTLQAQDVTFAEDTTLTLGAGAELSLDGGPATLDSVVFQDGAWVSGHVTVVVNVSSDEGPATLTVDGSVTMQDGSIYAPLIGATSGDQIFTYDNVTPSTGSMLELRISGADKFTAAASPYVLIDATESEDGILAEFLLVGDLGGYVTGDWLTYEGKQLVLKIDKDLHPGDANLDTNTDVRDFNLWNASKFTSDTGWATGDFNGDRITDVRDFNLWNAAKFTSAGEAPPLVEGEVPEPSAPVLLVCGTLGLLLIRRRHWKSEKEHASIG